MIFFFGDDSVFCFVFLLTEVLVGVGVGVSLWVFYVTVLPFFFRFSVFLVPVWSGGRLEFFVSPVK